MTETKPVEELITQHSMEGEFRSVTTVIGSCCQAVVHISAHTYVRTSRVNEADRSLCLCGFLFGVHARDVRD